MLDTEVNYVLKENNATKIYIKATTFYEKNVCKIENIF